jgi:hypothetical protein
MNDLDRARRIASLVRDADQSNLGDILGEALQVYLEIADPGVRMEAEVSLSALRFMASGADVGWPLSSSPVVPNRPLSDLETIQLAGIERALHEMAYGFEMVEKSAEEGWGGSSRTRFYLNSLYHYIGSMFLIDTSKKSHRGLHMGGTVVRALHPLGLSDMLAPVNAILSRPFGDKLSFGEAILMQRHSYLVHGTFSPENVEYLVSDTHMRNPVQLLVFRENMWDLFYSTVLLRLRLLAILNSLDMSLEEVVSRYLQEGSNA